MKITELSIARPVTVTMCILIVLILGWVSLDRLPLDLLPELNFPIAAVVTTYEGAAPQEVESHVTRPIEEVMTTVGNVTNVSSTSTRGQSLVLVEFNWGTDMDFAALEMREQLDLIEPLLPDDASSPRVLRFDPSQLPIMQLAVGGSLSLPELKMLADETIKSRLERIEGVASVQVLGGTEPQVHVLLDPTLMRVYGISFSQVTQALQAANLNLPGGQIEEGSRQVSVRTTGQFATVDEIARIRIPTPAGGVLLRDIAAVRAGESDTVQHTRLNRRPSLGINILKETGANSVTVARAVRAELERLEREYQGILEFVVVADEAEFVEASVNSVMSNAIAGGVLAMLILVAFLRNVRSTLVIATSIPISIVATFILIYFAGMTLNMLSLGGLALGIGMLVDNAIVVLENIFRHRQFTPDPKEAAVRGTSEVATAIAASTLTTIAVFLPVVFIEGLAAQIFRDLSLTVSFSLIVSLAVAVTLVPLLCAHWLGRRKAGVQPLAHAEAGAAVDNRGFGDGGSKLVAKAADLLASFVRRALSRKRWVFLVAAAAMASALALVPLIGAEFLPAIDEGLIQISLSMPKGTRLGETDAAASALEAYLLGIPEVESVFTSVGSVEAPDEGSLLVRLVPLERRSRSTQEVVEAIRASLPPLPGAEVEVEASSTFVGGGAGGAPIQVELRGDDLDLLRSTALELKELIAALPGIANVSTSFDEGRPEVQVRVLRQKADELGITVAQIASAVRTAVSGDVATVLRTGSDEIDVVVRLDERFRGSVESLAQIPIATAVGMIPLGELAELVEETSPLSVDRSAQSRAVRIYAHASAGQDLGSAASAIEALLAEHGLPPGIDAVFGGEVQQMQEAFADLGLALVLAVILVYAVLASQFESLIQPLAIIFSVPLAFVGAVWGLALTGQTLNVASFIGIIMLTGIVVNNAIVLVDFVNQLRARGMERTEALAEAARTRLRPILMTTLTTVLGMIPLALGIGEGSELEAPIAVAVIGGLSVSTLLTLVVVPAAYAALEDAAAFFRRAIARPFAKGVA